MIDIVVTYLNPRDEKWQEDYNYWKNKEIKEKKALASNRQAFGIERAREWDTFKYWFRGIEKNCPWINNVFLICQNERHIPKWLNRDNPRLKIVFHEDYIPKELLPTFNAMTIGVYISNIKELSDNYILSDDDYYFLNPIKQERFFIDNTPVHADNKVTYMLYGGSLLRGSDYVFYHILNNDLKFETQITKKKIKYGIYHLPEARKKSFEQEILNKYAKEIMDHNNKSKFRHQSNLCSYMYSDLLKINNEAILGNPYYNCTYCTLKSNVDFNNYKNKDIVCFNDTEQLDDYDKTKEKLVEFLEEKFPDKCSFEL